MLWGPNPIGVRRLMALVNAISHPSPASAEASRPRPMSDAGAISRVIPIRYTPKKAGD